MVKCPSSDDLKCRIISQIRSGQITTYRGIVNAVYSPVETWTEDPDAIVAQCLYRLVIHNNLLNKVTETGIPKEVLERIDNWEYYNV